MFEANLLKDQVAVITGGGTGIGLAIAKRLGALGARIAIASRNAEHLEQGSNALRDTGVDALAVQLDVRNPEQVDEMVLRTVKHFGGLDILVNNAAGNFISRTKDLSPRGFNAIADIVFRGSFYMTLACGKRWIDEKKKASVISILTTWIWNGGPFTVPSAMSKAGLNIMTKSLATEWGPHGIRLNAIAPGPFPTKGAWERLSPQAASGGRGEASDRIPMGRNGEMYELANLAVFLMADGCEYLTGQTIAIDGAGHLGGTGNFAALSRMGDEQWEAIRNQIRSANDKDKAQRTA